MLTAYFDIVTKGSVAAVDKQQPQQPQQPPSNKSEKRPKSVRKPKQKDPKPTEAAAAGASVHARFVPLPPEADPPRPAETAHQAWQGLQPDVVRDDEVAAADWDVWEEDDAENEDDDVSEPDFEPESLDPAVVDDSLSSSGVSSSLEDSVGARFSVFRRRVKLGGASASVQKAMYSGPQLAYEDDDFE